jgi:hypothetical protein
MPKARKKRPKAKTGPKEQRLKLRGDWQALIGKALAKKRPKKGWPKARKP